ncbi:Bpu10I family restriction endonuclease [Argonema antarcticum]|uniref:Bpu10I family restriction endonuclease n=1 Tax=Argonema antarcticum TaxID=2942763 RepID=UPI0020123A09|nr:Bpu10I family restriction endonuclease [Argonema antarcticum]MCL1472241.1 Bpu10I family restriction endonuclease [Argonema antarcticum A004/B2]
MEELNSITEEDLKSEEKDLLPVQPDSRTPHYDKLQKLLSNQKLPQADKESVQNTIAKYREWIKSMDGITSEGDEKVKALVNTLNDYKTFVEVELIWDSEADFLYRQRGQLKLDNSILEEFLPRLVDPAIIPALKGQIYITGPRTTFAGAYFTTTLTAPQKGAGLQIRKKNQDFTVGRTAYLKSSFDEKFPANDTVTLKIYFAFLAAECKTNLDSTMFPGLLGTARDLKMAFPGSRYYILCEWLDMPPISTADTNIDEVIILRGKRLASDVRNKFAKSSDRKKQRNSHREFLLSNPIREDRVLRFVNHMRNLFGATVLQEDEVLARGYF